MNILYIGELLFLAGNVALAYYHAHRFDQNKSINHAVWAAVVASVIIIFTYASRWNWYYGGALFLERIWCFNPILNLIRHKPFFYTHSEKVGGSWIDSKIDNAYPYIFVVSLIGFSILQFYI